LTASKRAAEKEKKKNWRKGEKMEKTAADQKTNSDGQTAPNLQIAALKSTPSSSLRTPWN
jgi:hypothetical protein